jgi:hypothetical protein
MQTMSSVTIDLSRLAGGGRVRNLSGKERGIAAREELSLDELDRQPLDVEVVVPDFIDTISPSFFQGLFSKSIRQLAGREHFLEKYHFQATDKVMRWIEIGIRNATSSREKLI